MVSFSVFGTKPLFLYYTGQSVIIDASSGGRVSIINTDVLYHMRILYHTRMVHTICVYAYGTTIRVWYGKSYHLSIAITWYAYNIKQKVFALPYLLTTSDGTLLSFLFGEEGGGGASLSKIEIL